MTRYRRDPATFGHLLLYIFTLKSDNNMKTVRQCPFVVNQSPKLMEDAETELSGVGPTDGELSGKVVSIDDSSGAGLIVLATASAAAVAGVAKRTGAPSSG